MGVNGMGLYRLNGERGMTLIEVMFIVAASSMLGLGMASLFKNVTESQRRVDYRLSLYEIQSRIEQTIRNERAWANTVNNALNNASLGCLRANTAPCANATRGAFALFDQSNNLVFNGISATGGLTSLGLPCNTYNAAGNDACPFRYNLTTQTQCPAASCAFPEVRVRGTLAFAPGARLQVSQRFNLTDFQIDVTRGFRTRYEPFELRFEDSDNNNNLGGGRCRQNQWVPRPLNVLVDLGGGDSVVLNAGSQAIPPDGGMPLPPGHVAALAPAATNIGEFTLRPGAYECHIVAQGFQPRQGFKIRLRDVNDVVPPIDAGGGEGDPGQVVYSNGTIRFSLKASRTFRLEHFCVGESDPTFTPPPYAPGSPPLWLQTARERSYYMGLPIASYAGGRDATIYTSVSCVRSS